MRVPSAIVVGSFVLSIATLGAVGCASDDSAEKKGPSVGKHAFSPADYELDFLDKDKTAERLSPMVVDKIKIVLEMIEKRLPQVLAPVPPPVPQAVMFAVDKGKPILQQKLEQKLTTLISENRVAVDPVVQRYNVFGHPDLSYDLLDPADGQAAGIIDNVNKALKDAYRTVRAIRLARMLLKVTREDAEAIKAAPDAAKFAGVGIGALSITHISLEAIEDAQQIMPELQTLSQDLTNQMGANIMLAPTLAPALKEVGAVSADLATVPKDAADLLTEASELLKLFDT